MSNVVIGGFKTTKTSEFQAVRRKALVAHLHPACDIDRGRGEEPE